MAVAFTKTIRKWRKAHGQTFDHHICDLPQHPWNWFQHPRLRNPALEEDGFSAGVARKFCFVIYFTRLANL